MVPVIDEANVPVAILLERLRWPVKMVRWRAAKEIRRLLASPVTRAPVSVALLSWMGSRSLESEVLSALSVLVVTPRDHIPSFDAVTASIGSPSFASDFLLREIFGETTDAWLDGHSGVAPDDFVAEPYFSQFKASHVGGALSHELEYLEKRLELPFMKQWGFEWTQLRKLLGVGYTRYPTYFGDFGLQRQGIVGQFLQRQSEVYRSAYQRTLACAVDSWGVHPGALVQFVAYGLPVLPDLFEVDPIPRPPWLPALNADTIGEQPALPSVARAILAAQPASDLQVVQLRIPLDRSFSEFGELEISAFLVSPDFELGANQVLRTQENIHELDRYRFDGSRPVIEMRPRQGAVGTAISVCCDEIPSTHGFWHGEYYHRGLALPAPYCFERATFHRATTSGLTSGIGGEMVGALEVWHDAWTPMYAPNSATRCGTITRMKRNRLDAAAKRLGLKVGWFVRLSRMQKPAGGYELEPTDATAFFDAVV